MVALGSTEDHYYESMKRESMNRERTLSGVPQVYWCTRGVLKFTIIQL